MKSWNDQKNDMPILLIGYLTAMGAQNSPYHLCFALMVPTLCHFEKQPPFCGHL